MTMRHLAVFIAVVDNDCSVTKASEVLHVAQPSVSQTIAELEEQYSIRLFDRLSRRLYLTPEGAEFAGYARRLVDDFTELDEMMKTSAGTAPLRIGASFTTGTVLLPELLRKNPEIHAEVSVCNTRDIERMILESRLDAAIIEGNVESSDLVQMPLIKDELVFAASPEYTAGRNPVFILREKGSGTRELSDTMLKIWTEKNGQQPVVWEVANTQTICALVKAVQGTTIISRGLIQTELSDGTLIDTTPADDNVKKAGIRMFRLVHHRDKYIDVRMQQFIDGTYNLLRQ
ncbi:MAG: LysR substrate-binding domain-containing protein [Treponema sp.]|nr:LysR substrate-binding domain-containing protein [Treponema sp.]